MGTGADRELGGKGTILRVPFSAAISPDLSLTTGGEEQGVGSMPSLAAFEGPAPVWSSWDAKRPAGLDELLRHAAWALRGGPGVTQRRRGSFPSRLPTWPGGGLGGGGTSFSPLGCAPAPNWHLQKPRTSIAPLRSPEAISCSRGKEMRSPLCYILYVLCCEPQRGRVLGSLGCSWLKVEVIVPSLRSRSFSWVGWVGA